MAQAVIHSFEIVQIQEYDSHPAVVALGMQYCLREAVREQSTIGKPGECIVVGHEPNAVFRLFAFNCDAGNARGDIDKTSVSRSWFAHRRRIQCECAENSALVRQYGSGPARPEAMHRRQFAIVLPEWIALDVGDDDCFPPMDGRAARPHFGADANAVYCLRIFLWQAGCSRVPQVYSFFVEQQDGAEYSNKLRFDELHKMVEHIFQRRTHCNHFQNLRLPAAQYVRLFALCDVPGNADQAENLVLVIEQWNFRGRAPLFACGIEYAFIHVGHRLPGLDDLLLNCEKLLG